MSERPKPATLLDTADVLGRFVVLLSDQTSPCTSVKCCLWLLQLWNSMLNEQHTKLAMCGVSRYPGMTVCQRLGMESVREGYTWDPLWTTIPEASKACQELIRCGCKGSWGQTIFDALSIIQIWWRVWPGNVELKDWECTRIKFHYVHRVIALFKNKVSLDKIHKIKSKSMLFKYEWC